MFKYFNAFFLTLTLAMAGSSISSIELESKGELLRTDATYIAFYLHEANFPSEKVGSYTHKKLLLCDNGLSGSFAYKTDESVVLYPEVDLKSSTKYSCSINEEYLESTASSVSFTTENFKITNVRFFPEGNIRVVFNDKVKEQELKKFLHVKKEKKLAQTELSYSIEKSHDERSFLIHINEDIAASQISIEVEKSLVSFSGSSLKKEYKNSFKEDSIPYYRDEYRRSMTIYDTPRFHALKDGSLAIRLYFEGTFDGDGLIKKFIKIKEIKNFNISESDYVYSWERRKYKLSKRSYYYVDITGDFESNKSYEIILKEGLKDSYNFQLREDKIYTVTMGDRKPFLKFESSKPYLSSLGEIGFESTNVASITLVVEKLLDQNYRYFINFDGGDTDSLKYLGKEVLSKKFALDGKKNAFTKHKVSLKPFIGNFDSGVYRMVVHYDDDKTESKAVYFSDLGILSKLSNDQLFVSVSRLSNTKAIPGAEVLLYSAKNELIDSGRTNSEGIWIFEKKNLAEQEPNSVVVNYKKEQNFLVLDSSLNGVSVPYYERVYDKYKALIYFQSKLIRPGEDLSTLVVLKDKNFTSPVKMPLKITIKDPSYREIYSEEFIANEAGAINFVVPMLKEYKTGKYTLNVYFAGRVLGSKTFSIEAFMPQKIKNKIKFKKDAYGIDELLKAELSSEYLFGAPSVGLKAEVRLNAVAKRYTSTLYEDYEFNNRSLGEKNKVSYFDLRRTLVLNNQGEVKVALPLHVKQSVPSMLEAQMAFTVFDDGHGVAAYRRVDLYAYHHMVGVRLADRRIDKTKPLEVDTVLLDPLTQEHKKSSLDVFIKRYRWHYVYDSNGYYRWSKEYETIENFRVTSGEHFSRKLVSSGDYVIEIYDRLGGHSTTQNFSVRGWDYNPISPTDDMQSVQVDFENRPYKKGEVLKASITSPILEGRLLVTLEGEKVLWHKIVTLNKGNAAINIPLKDDLKDGLYLNTSVVRATDTPSSLIPFRARSSHFIKPDKEVHHIKTIISTPKITRSSRDVTIEVQSQKNAYVLVSVVDEGILQISGQEVPKPFEFFTRIADDKVAYFDLYDKVMHHLTQGKMLSFGGDSARKLKKAQKHKAAETGAKRVKPFVFWSGFIKTDVQGDATVKLPVPSFNGQAKIVALSLGKNAIGASSVDLIVRDDLIIKPTYPRFGLIGDTLSIPVRIFNTTEHDINASLHVKSSKQLSLDSLPEMISLAPKSSQQYVVKLHATSFGKGEVKITAKTLDETYAHQVELPITYGYPLQTHVLRGELSSQKSFQIPEKYFSKYALPKVEISVSNDFLAQLKGSVNYLVQYPYGCAEQTSSKMFAMLYIEAFLEGDTSDETKNLLADRDHFMKAGVTKLANIQRRSGEFAYWNRGSYVNPYASIYASDMMMHLKESGYVVPDALMNRVYEGLATMANGRGSYHYGKIVSFERMYAAYLLSEQEKLDISLVNTLYDAKMYDENLLTHYMMAAILKNAKMTKEMSIVLSIIEKYDYNMIPDVRNSGYDFYSRTRNLAFSLYIHVKNFKKNVISRRLLEATQKAAAHLYSTQEKAMVMRALATYYKDEKSDTMRVVLGMNSKEETYTDTFSIEGELHDAKLSLNSNSKLINYNIDVYQYLPKEIKHHQSLQNTKELNIRRSYVNEKGVELDLQDLAVGDLIYSKVEVQSPQRLQNIVISDRIPACFEIINERVHAHKRTQEVENPALFWADYQDIRDDRVLSFLSLPVPTNYKTYTSNAMNYFTPLRVTTAGECVLPAILTEAMYDSRITDYDKEVNLIYVKKNRQRIEKTQSSGLNQKW